MNINTTFIKYYYTAVLLISLGELFYAQSAQDFVSGNLIQFNDNGAWCWYQDERSVVDSENDILIVGSVGSSNGTGGYPRSGDIETVLFNLNAMTSVKYILKEGGGSAFYCDDHNAPAFLVRPDGKYLAVFAAHFNDTASYYRIYDGNNWGAVQKFNWNQERPGGSNFQTTYSNVYYLSAENRVYNFVRGNNKSPNSMISTDWGDTWTYGGQLAYGSNIGYNNGYYRYNGNGIDRIDFICTEYHPRDYNTSIYHGYIQDGRSYKSDGTLADDNIFDVTPLPNASDFTLVFAAGTVINNDTINRCWNTDVQRYPDGTVATVITARINNNTDDNDSSINPAHCFIYCRYNGTNWNYTYLGQAGFKLYAPEADYTGLAAMHPSDPNTIYISTTFDPRDNNYLRKHEIFKGETIDDGATWNWTAITQNSTRDNLRPIIPAWNDENTAVLWWRGTYSSAQSYDAAVVGIIDRKNENVGLMTYVDASAANTFFSDGSSLVTTSPDGDRGAADNQWHERTGFGNGGSVLTSAEIGGENSPLLKTQITLPNEGTYDIWVNFWANPSYDWRIKAGLSEANMQIYRHMACKQVEENAHATVLTRTGGGNTFLYQAYIGRIYVNLNYTINVFIDDHAITTGSSSTLTGDAARTWYDGISYASINPEATFIADKENLPTNFELSQNYPNPFNPTTTIKYTLNKPGQTKLVIFNILGKEIKTLVDSYQLSGSYSSIWDATDNHNQPVTSGIYFYSLLTHNKVLNKKMVLIK